MAATGKAARLEALRAQVARLEGHGTGHACAVIPFGAPALDTGVAGCGIAMGALHEVAGVDPGPGGLIRILLAEIPARPTSLRRISQEASPG